MAKKLNKSYDVATGVLTVEIIGAGEVAVSLADLSEDVIRQAALHGLSQKLGDVVAAKECVGDTALAMIKSVVDSLYAGKWGAERASGTGGGKMALYVEAISRLQGVPVEQVAATLEGLSDEQQKAIRGMPAVKAMVDVIKAEKARVVLESGDNGLGAMFGG